MVLIEENARSQESSRTVANPNVGIRSNTAGPRSKHGSEKGDDIIHNTCPEDGGSLPDLNRTTSVQGKAKSKPATLENLDEVSFKPLPQGRDTNLMSIYFDLDSNRWEMIESVFSVPNANFDRAESSQSLSATDRSRRTEKKTDLFTNFIQT
jgi:hypothetical protein